MKQTILCHRVLQYRLHIRILLLLLPLAKGEARVPTHLCQYSGGARYLESALDGKLCGHLIPAPSQMGRRSLVKLHIIGHYFIMSA